MKYASGIMTLCVCTSQKRNRKIIKAENEKIKKVIKKQLAVVTFFFFSYNNNREA